MAACFGSVVLFFHPISMCFISHSDTFWHIMAQPTAIYERQAQDSAASQRRAAWEDLRSTCGLWRLCTAYAGAEIKLRYRRTRLGPFLNSIAGVLLSTLTALVLSRAFSISLENYLPYFAISLMLWGTIGFFLTEGSEVYVRSATLMRAVRLPVSFIPARNVTLTFGLLAHDFLLVLLLLIGLGRVPLWAPIFVIPAIALWLFMSFWLALALGIFGARYRDVIKTGIAFGTQLLFFATPIMWFDTQLGDKAWLQLFNPAFVMIEIVRQPLLGNLPPVMAWVSALLWTALVAVASWSAFVRTRRHIAVWC